MNDEATSAGFDSSTRQSALSAFISSTNQPDWQQIRREFESIRIFLAKRAFGQFRNSVSPKTQFQRGLIELFIMSRIRKYVLAYLSVQEGEDFEGVDSYGSSAPLLIDNILFRLGGRESQFSIAPGIGSLRWRICLDPLVNLRRVYLTILASDGTTGCRPGVLRMIGLKYQAFLFRAKANIVKRMVGWLVPANLAEKPDELRKFFELPSVQRVLGMAVLLIFPAAKRLDRSEWDNIFNELARFFSENIPGLLRVLPSHSIQQHGLIKLAKVAFGTLVGRSSTKHLEDRIEVDFILQSIYLAYSWGITYPLVDNVLDSRQADEASKKELSSLLLALFEERTIDMAPIKDPICLEIHERISEVLKLIPGPNRDRTLSLLKRLLIVHQRDSSRKLSRLDQRQFETVEIIEDTISKSSLVRLATMELCGIPTTESTIENCEIRGLFNQLGDDLWDVYEDFQDDSATLATTFVSGKSSIEPFSAYIAYASKISESFSRQRTMATYLGCLETLRDCQLALRSSEDDALNITRFINDALANLGISEDDDNVLAGVPHVDFDAVLFFLEEGILAGEK